MNYYLQVFRNYANFNGRARRSEYWYFTLFHVIVLIVLAAISGYIGLPVLYFVYILFAFLPSLAVGVRRMHDVGKSGWYLLIPIYSLILACTEGDKGDNKYGLDPKHNYFME